MPAYELEICISSHVLSARPALYNLFQSAILDSKICPCSCTFSLHKHCFACNFIWKEFLHRKGDKTLGWAGVTIPGSVQERTGHGTPGSGLVDKVLVGQKLALLTAEVFSNQNNSVISCSFHISAYPSFKKIKDGD